MSVLPLPKPAVTPLSANSPDRARQNRCADGNQWQDVVMTEGAGMNQTLNAEELLATDRCDRCGAQAYVRVHLNSGGELMFCAHHGHEYDSALRQVAADIHDESQRLNNDAPAAE